ARSISPNLATIRRSFSSRSKLRVSSVIYRAPEHQEQQRRGDWWHGQSSRPRRRSWFTIVDARHDLPGLSLAFISIPIAFWPIGCSLTGPAELADSCAISRHVFFRSENVICALQVKPELRNCTKPVPETNSDVLNPKSAMGFWV